MKEINQKIIGSSEKNFTELVEKNKEFFEKIKTEEMQRDIRKELKEKKSFGNKDKHYKKCIAEKWSDQRLAQL